MIRTNVVTAVLPLCLALTLAAPAAAQDEHAPTSYQKLPSETPSTFVPTNDGFDYERRDVMIPMRDGVKLHTVILVPKGAENAPILLTRTPYDATALTTHAESSDLGRALDGYDNAVDVIVDGGYIRVVQDVRGKFGSEGDYVMNRPPRGPQNPTPVDHATDTWDTIDWLVTNIPGDQRQGGHPRHLVRRLPRTDAALRPAPGTQGGGADEPHGRRLDGRRLVPLRRLPPAEHALHLRPGGLQEVGRQVVDRATSTITTCTWRRGPPASWAGSAGSSRWVSGARSSPTPITTPSGRSRLWTSCWPRQPLRVPVMLVHGLWDQEDIYGDIAVYEAIEPKDTDNDMVFLVLGPWNHGQQIHDGSSLGPLKFGSDTALTFRREVLAPFLAHYLQNDPPAAVVPPVVAYETGTNTWRKLTAWPSGCAEGCEIEATPLYLGAGLGLGFASPGSGDEIFDEYVSDPAKPVPYRARPIQPVGYEDEGLNWPEWLVDDQREASGRPDVVVFTSEVLTQPVKISGQPIANLVASTSGTDSDWVIKLIDVWPDQVAGQPKMGGYQLMVSADVFRGRYRESLETPSPLAANQPLLYRFELPTANHVFLPRPPHHGPDPVELVPPLRSQPADLRAEHLLGEARGLSEGDATHLSRPRSRKLHRAAAGEARVKVGHGPSLKNFEF